MARRGTDNPWFDPDPPPATAPRVRGGRASGQVQRAAVARAAYGDHKKAITGLLGSIKSGLDAHAKKAAASPKDWGYTGDLEHYHEKLSEAAGQEPKPMGRSASGVSAAAAYATKSSAVKGKLDEVAKHVDDHARSAGSSPSWGHVGDLSATRKSLQEVHDSLHGEGEYAKTAAPAARGHAMSGLERANWKWKNEGGMGDRAVEPARLRGSMAKLAAAPKATQTGVRGGQFSITATGRKVYKGKA